jgi:DDE superfamily endonuclease
MGEPRMAEPNWQCPSDWSEWSQWLAAGLHARNRWRLPVLLVGILFAQGRRTVTTWLRAAGVSDDYQDYYYFLAALGRKSKSVATQLLVLLLRVLPLPDRLLAVIDDTPTKRYGPHVEGADIHHNPTPGPADQKYLYGHIWVTLSLAVRHPRFGALALPLQAMLYVRRRTMAKIPKWRGWTFATKLVLAARLVEWIAPIVKEAGKTLWIVVDGGYVKAPFLKRALRAKVTIIGRLRKDAALRDLPPKLRRGQRRPRGRPPQYGKNRISLAKRASHRQGWQTAECTVYGQKVTKLYKTFLATYRPVGGLIRVVIVEEDHDWYPFFSTDPNATAVEIIEAFADRATIEQDFHDVKEVWGAGQQQVRNIWTNLAVYHLNLWMHTLVELWSWNRSHDELTDRSLSPWDDADRRPSHADRRKALRQHIVQSELSSLAAAWWLPRKILDLIQRLAALAA